MPAEKTVLNQEDWIKAGFRALSCEGLKGVKVEALARSLKISKGSFYWHFKDQKDLRRKMLAHWKQVATLAPSEAVMNAAISPRERLEHLIAFAAKGGAEEYGGRFAEVAVREWARVDDDARAVVDEVDQLRIGVLNDQLLALGIAPKKANLDANILYAALLGLDHLPNMHEEDVQLHVTHLLDAIVSA